MEQTFRLARIVIYAPDVPTVVKFYNRVFGFPIVGGSKELEYIELNAGGCLLSVHRGEPPPPHPLMPKPVFHSDRVNDDRARLMREGLHVGRLMGPDDALYFDARDPAGNTFQISSLP
jgi:predicted enzyme related to lactoylglutathione lyase